MKRQNGLDLININGIVSVVLLLTDFPLGKCELHFDGHGRHRQYFQTTNNMMYTHQADFDEDSEG